VDAVVAAVVEMGEEVWSDLAPGLGQEIEGFRAGGS